MPQDKATNDIRKQLLKNKAKKIPYLSKYGAFLQKRRSNTLSFPASTVLSALWWQGTTEARPFNSNSTISTSKSKANACYTADSVVPQMKNLDPKRTHPLVWFLAIICTIVAVAVIIAGLVIFIGYMIIRPTVPFITVRYAHMDKLDYDQTGTMDTQISLVIEAENGNARAHASFSDMSFFLYFQSLEIAELAAGPFEVAKNKSVDLQYVVPSLSVPLEPRLREEVDASLKQGRISFHLKGQVRAQWRVGVVGSVKFWSHMSCQLKFFTNNGTRINSRCSSKSN